MPNISMLDHVCPVCKTVCDAVCPMEGDLRAAPIPGDVTVCAHCQTILVFEDDMSVRVAMGDEIKDWPDNLQEMVGSAVIRAIRGDYGKEDNTNRQK